ncbi:protein windpipe isoform X1 [Microplitis demolitor]|uniref:protein windpipe isoform X1 n=1 Tax=Microplitis demolitor TaxID=69319 RepID=UPI0004CCB9F8|nr:protein windpipe isoform X1 [Microplitis demolitor]
MPVTRVACSSSLVVFMLTLVLLSEPRPSNGLCTFKKNGTSARCHYLEDVNAMDEILLEWLKSLKVLSAGRHLSADSGVFDNLTNLRHLDLSNGKLKTIDPSCFRHLRSLRSLDLSDNHLTHLSPGTFVELDHLESLNLKKNSLEQIPADIVNLNSLKYLDISHNNLNCDCEFLKTRDSITKRGLSISKKTECNGPESLKGQLLIELETHRVCMIDEADSLEGMQMDQPLVPEGSGEGSGDAFDELEAEDIPEEDENITNDSEINVNTTSIPVEVSLTPETTTSGPGDEDDGIFFTEDADKHTTTTTTTTSTASTATEIDVETTTATETVETTAEVDKDNELWSKEGSGDDDADDPWINEGSGEGSGSGIPHITWDDGVLQQNLDETNQENSSVVSTSTTSSGGLIDSLFSIFWGTTTESSPTSTTEDLDLEEEQFIKATSEATLHEEKPTEREEKTDSEVITPVHVVPVGSEDIKPRVLDDGKLEQVKEDTPADVTDTTVNAKASDAAADTQQTQKGMGSYIVLAILLAVLATLIAFAAYKGNFCKGGRKRNDHNDNNDVENGTELKDLRKSLLETSNSVQPKIATNGNNSKPETLPLVKSAKEADDDIAKLHEDEPSARYIGTLSDSAVDPVKPPRKSFSPNDVDNNEYNKMDGTGGKIVTTPQLSSDPSIMRYPRVSNNRDIITNGNGTSNNRDSLSSLGGSPSIGSHSRLSNSRLNHDLQPPASPGAQRVKITLQDIPDSVPKTPLLITRTKAGENLVKTS